MTKPAENIPSESFEDLRSFLVARTESGHKWLEFGIHQDDAVDAHSPESAIHFHVFYPPLNDYLMGLGKNMLCPGRISILLRLGFNSAGLRNVEYSLPADYNIEG